MKNKKEPLSIIVVKTLLAVIIFTGLGTIIIGGAYLIGKQGVISSNEFTIKEKTALDPRCSEKVEVSGWCYGIWRGYEFNSETGKCVEVSMSGCSIETPFKTLEECQEVCEKVKKELVEEVIIITDKTEYEQGEIVEITVHNNSDKTILFRELGYPCFSSFSVGIKREDYRMFYDLGIARCLTDMEELKSNAERVFLLKVDDINKTLALTNTFIIYPETYKLELNCGFSSEDLEEKTIYSNEFTIKEKSALDPRKCKDNISLTWKKSVDGVWTSEDMTRKPRHYTHTNICYEKSNKEIWNLCKNEGCVDYTDTGIEVLCFGSACSPEIDILTKKCYLECPG